MKRFTTNEEIENLCEAMIKDFFRSRQTEPLCVDIEAFVTEYLGIPVVYETFAEPEPGRIGFLSDGKRPLRIMRGNEEMQTVFPENTVVLEKSLLSPKERARKRFTLAHEGAHVLLKRHVPLQTTPEAAFHSEFDDNAEYSRGALREMLLLSETLANRAAACFLMPGFLMDRVLKKYNSSKKVVLYAGNILAQDQKLLIRKMAEETGVSYTAFFNRLRELQLFEIRPVEEYLHKGLGCGGR